MSTDSKVLPLLNRSLGELETVHDVLFSARASFWNAVMERPTGSCVKDLPKLFDGERILLNAIDRVLLLTRESVRNFSTERDDLVSKVKSSERSRANHITALRQLAMKRALNRVATKTSTNVPRTTACNQIGKHQILIAPKLPEKKLKGNTSSTYPPALKLLSASPKRPKIKETVTEQKIGV